MSDTSNKPRKMNITVTITDLTEYGPSARIVRDTISTAFTSLRGIQAEIKVEELKCNCDNDAWPSYCAYHDKKYGF